MIEGKLVLIANRKSYMSFWLILKSVTLNYLEQRDGRYFALIYMNDIQYTVSNAELKLFADDTNLFLHNSDPNQA